MVTCPQIGVLPLNGRNPLELAKLEPGAQQPTKVSNNRTVVPLLGDPVDVNGRATRVTVDSGSVMEIGNGGSAMGFSQEEVQEFEVSTVNPDLSTGVTASGAVNVATRSGSNQAHGSTFLFFRNHHLSAYPGLHRNPFNPDPFFQRKQFGLSAGGPIRKDRVFSSLVLSASTNAVSSARKCSPLTLPSSVASILVRLTRISSLVERISN